MTNTLLPFILPRLRRIYSSMRLAGGFSRSGGERQVADPGNLLIVLTCQLPLVSITAESGSMRFSARKVAYLDSAGDLLALKAHLSLWQLELLPVFYLAT